MKIHADTLTEQDLRDALPEGVVIGRLDASGSRKRDHAFLVKLAAHPGKDAHGITRRFAYNAGSMMDAGGTDGTYRSLTWVEYGDWMVELFKIDPAAIIGPYEGDHEFVAMTYEAAPHRAEREDAEYHAERWSRDLWHAEQDRADDRRVRHFTGVGA